MEQTAVEWLVEYFSKYVDMNKHLEEIEQAKEMEKEQNIEFVRLNLNKAIKSFRPKLLLIAIMLIMCGVLLSINL